MAPITSDTTAEPNKSRDTRRRRGAKHPPMQHPIIALWSDPTLDARALQKEINDNYTIFVKPFSPLTFLYESEGYYALKKRDILAASERGPVLIFDVTDKVSEDLLRDEEFLQRITHSFLVKDADQDQICQKVTTCADLAPILVDVRTLEECPEKAAEQYSNALGQKLIVKAMTSVPGRFLEKTAPAGVLSFKADLTSFSTTDEMKDFPLAEM